jgi:glutathione-regulated potassium-efflux system ancillary protein KefF
MNTLIIHAHPQPQQSTVVAGLSSVFTDQPNTAVRRLYDLYPDFDIDIAAEQQALLAADLVVWLAPIYWYSVPGLLKHWFDTVLQHGWAYGQGGIALQGKTAWWVTSAGAPQSGYTAQGQHGRPFADFVPTVEGVARYCGMHWAAPFVVHAGHHASAPERQAALLALQTQWQSLQLGHAAASSTLKGLAP